jgi:secreted trypsin-like serine protease
MGRVLLPLVLAVSVSACAIAQEPSESSRAAIFGGTVETAGSAVARRTVLFTTASGDGTHGCTATVLDGSHALTARHCIFGATVDEGLVLVFATAWSAEATTRPVTAMRSYNDGFDDDIAVIAFSGGLPDGYVPVKVADAGLHLTAGTPVVLAGYGKASDDSDGTERGILRSVASTFEHDDVAAKRVWSVTSVGGTCSGDSGGPDYATVNGELVQFGVHVSGDCATTAVSTDVRAYRDWIETQMRTL